MTAPTTGECFASRSPPLHQGTKPSRPSVPRPSSRSGDPPDVTMGKLRAGRKLVPAAGRTSSPGQASARTNLLAQDENPRAAWVRTGTSASCTQPGPFSELQITRLKLTYSAVQSRKSPTQRMPFGTVDCRWFASPRAGLLHSHSALLHRGNWSVERLVEANFGIAQAKMGP